MNYKQTIDILTAIMYRFYNWCDCCNAKTDTKITVTSNSTLYGGDYFSISLNDANGTPITNQTIKIGIIDAKVVKILKK